MPETAPEQEGTQVSTPEAARDMPKREASHGGSREPLWGMFLIAGMLLFVIASIAGIGWVVYSKWQGARMAENQPSITALSESSDEAVPPAESQQADTPQAGNADQQPAADSAEAAKKLEVSVLNGGAAKGSAGVLAEFLKTEGYAKTIAGNTAKDYAGTAVYHAASLEKEAEAVRTSVAKKYPQAKILPADATNKETTTSPVTIIIGK